MFSRSMQQQNSSAGIPVTLSPTVEFDVVKNPESRRMSHDVGSVKVTRPRFQQHRMSQPCPPIGGLQSITEISNTKISFGYASSVQQYESTAIKKVSSISSISYVDEEQPSTSSFNSPPFSHPNQIEDDTQMGEFFIRLSNRQVVPVVCECPSGIEADQFLQSLPEKQKEKLSKFIETEMPDLGEYHIWIQDEATKQITVISIKTLENHFRNQEVRRVKWRHLSTGRVSIYRYSVPAITTKFRLRLVHFMSSNYRCCILCVWCLVIFLISIGIVLTVVFGSAPEDYGRLMNGTTIVPRTGQQYAKNDVFALVRNVTSHSGAIGFQGGKK